MSWDGTLSYVASLLYSVRNLVQGGGDYSMCSLCNPIDCSMTGFPVLHHLLEFAQTHVH